MDGHCYELSADWGIAHRENPVLLSGTLNSDQEGSLLSLYFDGKNS